MQTMQSQKCEECVVLVAGESRWGWGWVIAAGTHIRIREEPQAFGPEHGCEHAVLPHMTDRPSFSIVGSA